MLFWSDEVDSGGLAQERSMCSSVRVETSFMMSTQRHTMTLVPYESRWLWGVQAGAEPRNSDVTATVNHELTSTGPIA